MKKQIRHSVVMLQTVRGHDDVEGKVDPIAKVYEAGQQYLIGDGLLRTFVSMGAVRLAENETAAETRETKVEEVQETKLPRRGGRKASA